MMVMHSGHELFQEHKHGDQGGQSDSSGWKGASKDPLNYPIWPPRRVPESLPSSLHCLARWVVLGGLQM